MKLKLKITKDILEKSKMCGQDLYGNLISQNCAFAVAYGEIIPKVSVGIEQITILFGLYDYVNISLTKDQAAFVSLFDRSSPEERPLIPEQEFDIEIPDNVIEYYYQDYAVLAQKIADSKILQPA